MADDVKAEESWSLHLKQSRTKYRDAQFDCVRSDILEESLSSQAMSVLFPSEQKSSLIIISILFERTNGSGNKLTRGQSLSYL